ncbi:MAG TPA: metallophosphoesterase [Terriglobales bacterium]|nr:metallophosphoesterase [Terriglobales bacterium]
MRTPNAAVAQLLKLSPQDLDNIKRSIQSEAAPGWFAELSIELQSADYMLAMLMYDQTPKIWSPVTPPVQPAKYDPQAPIELGPVLFSIEHPLPANLLNHLSPILASIVKKLWWVLGEVFSLNGVKTQIQPTDFSQLLLDVENTAIIADDGTAYGIHPYEQLDEGWLWSVVNWAAYWLSDYITDKLHYPPHLWPWKPAPFNTQNASVIPLGAGKSQIKIAVFGDWGSGQAVPAQLLTQIMSNKPDYLIHLGDVYYAGTSDLDVLDYGEETRNLLDVLHAAGVPDHTCFTLNSNHEMYGGARGYYAALADPLFSLQKGSSYFALQFGGWTIFALDSAYYATKMFMNGVIPGAPNAQFQWVHTTVQQQNISPDKIMLMTHHNGLTEGWTGKPIAQTGLWQQASAALNGNPAYWYWGHVHNGIVYTPQAATGITRPRCLGHAALPFGNAWNLQALVPQQVEYYSHTPGPVAPFVLNGFAILTISQNATVQEAFYELGNPNAVH